MLLFEGSCGTVLYTGDFRLYSHQSHRLILSKKRIDTLYIDMTFFEPSIRRLPEREQACEKLIHFIEQYELRDFYLKTSARVGYEYIYTRLYQHFGTFIHVNAEQYHLYDCLPQVQQALTTDANRTRLHACWPRCSETKSAIKVRLRQNFCTLVFLCFSDCSFRHVVYLTTAITNQISSDSNLFQFLSSLLFSPLLIQ